MFRILLAGVSALLALAGNVAAQEAFPRASRNPDIAVPAGWRG